MSYTTLEQIKIRLDMYSVITEQGQSVISFDVNPKADFKIEQLIEKAKSDIKDYRNYPSTYTEEKISEDIEQNYKNILIDLVLYDWSIEGMDYESNHSENGVNRTFVKRETILGKVTPFCKIL